MQEQNVDEKNSKTVDGWLTGIFSKKKPNATKPKGSDQSKAVTQLRKRVEHLAEVIDAKNHAINNQNVRIGTHINARSNMSNMLAQKEKVIVDLKKENNKIIRNLSVLQHELEEKEYKLLELSANENTDWESDLYKTGAHNISDIEESYELIIAKKEQTILKLRGLSEKRMEAINNVKASRDKLLEGNKRIRSSFESARARGQYFSENPAINRYLRFARNCLDIADELKADVYCGHGVMPMPAIAALQEAVGGLSVCDAIEIPAFSKRAVTSTWHPTTLRMIDMAMESYLRYSDYIVTVGWALGSLLQPINPDVRVLPNYRYQEKVKPNTIFREKFGLSPDHKVILSISTIASGFENVLEALQKLPSNIHLVCMGKFVPSTYEEEVMNLVDKLGVRERAHFMGFVPYNELADTAGGADIGLIIRDPSIPNNQISLPNRVFDYMMSGLPIVSPFMPDIDKIITENNFGVSIPDMECNSWVDGISSALFQKDEMRKNALRAARKLTWESLESSLPEIFGSPKTITFLGFSDLTKNNRTMRIAKSLAKHGIKVKIAGPVSKKVKLPKGVKLISVEPG